MGESARSRAGTTAGLLKAILALAVLASFAASGCGGDEPKPQAPPPAPVSLYKAFSKDVPYYLTAIGQVFTIKYVTVRSKVTGYLQDRHVGQGVYVKEGERLFTIDPTNFKAQVDLYTAQLASDIDTYEQARRDFLRYERLAKRGVVSEDEFEQYRLSMKTAKDKIAMTRANLANAKNDLRYTFIRSPLAGLTGYIYPNVGDLVVADQDELVKVNQIAPIGVNFYLPQRYLPEVQAHQANGTLKVVAIIEGRDEPAEGNLTFVDNQIDVDTGTIWLQGTFPNQDAALWPGNYVQVRLQLYVEEKATLIPMEATSHASEGDFVWVAHPGNKTVGVQPVVIERRSGTWDVVAKGLKPGDVVVTDGQVRCYPGATYVVHKSPDARQDLSFMDANATNATGAANATAKAKAAEQPKGNNTGS